MVAVSPTLARCDRVKAIGIPVIDLSCKRPLVSELIVRACEEFGFFMVTNHSVPDSVICQMEANASEFFALSTTEKQRAGPPSPLGYGSKMIGCNGDTGEVEYLLLHTSPTSISQRSRSISRKDPAKICCVMNEYVKALRKLACEILDLLAEGLGLVDSEVFSRMVMDSQSDSLLRMNHYPPYHSTTNSNSNATKDDSKTNKDTRGKVGFGEHTDPQILTILRSNGVPGLQVLSPPDGGVWIPVPPDPTLFCVNVGDLIQAMTNGRLVSARHRAMVCSYSSRLSLVYFSAPPLDTWISPLPEMITAQSPQRYRSFKWGEYKKAMYALRLGYDRLELFRIEEEDDDDANSKR